ncbi:MAG: hypothetical protein ACHQYQ_08020 [Bacteriovoracales bacterium]
MGARINTIDQLKETTDAFLSGQFEGGRHKERLAIFEDLGERI